MLLTTPLVEAAQLYLSNEKGGRRRGKPVGEFLDVRLVGRWDPYASFGIVGSRVTQEGCRSEPATGIRSVEERPDRMIVDLIVEAEWRPRIDG